MKIKWNYKNFITLSSVLIIVLTSILIVEIYINPKGWLGILSLFFFVIIIFTHGLMLGFILGYYLSTALRPEREGKRKYSEIPYIKISLDDKNIKSIKEFLDELRTNLKIINRILERYPCNKDSYNNKPYEAENLVDFKFYSGSHNHNNIDKIREGFKEYSKPFQYQYIENIEKLPAHSLVLILNRNMTKDESYRLIKSVVENCKNPEKIVDYFGKKGFKAITSDSPYLLNIRNFHIFHIKDGDKFYVVIPKAETSPL